MKEENNKDIEFPKKFKLVSYYEKEWEESKKRLSNLKTFCINENNSIKDKFQELSTLIQHFQNIHRKDQYEKISLEYYSFQNCKHLKQAINSYYKDNESAFYTKILPFIIDQSILLEERAKNKYNEQTLPLMPSKIKMKESFPKILFLSIISNNFFCNHKDFRSQLNPEQKKLTKLIEWNTVDWFKIYNCITSTYDRVAIERIICLIAYFDFAYKIIELKNNNYFEKDIIIERIVFDPNEINNKLLECETKFEENDINIHIKDMDNPEIITQSIVNFANRNFQTGQILASATQEEVLFCVRPELYSAMFICQRVYENEIIIISNAYKLMENTGYLETFKFQKLKENIILDNNNIKDNENVLCLDATFKEHYLFKSVIQDISKFYIACNYCSKKYENAGISTGSWGCGAFWCDKAHKFLQQLICSKANNVKLSYSTFGNQQYYNSLIKLLKTVIQKKPKVSDLYKLIINFKGEYDREFHKYLKKELGNEFYI